MIANITRLIVRVYSIERLRVTSRYGISNYRGKEVHNAPKRLNSFTIGRVDGQTKRPIS